MEARQARSGPILNCAGRVLDLSHPVVMGILNTTPDSFSDGGELFRVQSAGAAQIDVNLVVKRASEMVDAGAKILDIGGESTRPGAVTVGVQAELERVIPAVEAIAREFEVIVSIDTSKPEVMQAAAAAGAGLINDVRALQAEGALQVAAATELPICLMHMQGEPKSMQQAPQYENVVAEVAKFLDARVAACEAHGIKRERLLLDPGFGFGKTLAHNVALLRDMTQITTLGMPVLVGLSRKSMIGALLNKDVDDRLAGGLALALFAVDRGAAIVRTHDVAATVDALTVWRQVQEFVDNG